jgi:hypothetical protein
MIAKRRRQSVPDRAGYHVIDQVTGVIYEPTGEYRRPRAMEDFLDPEAGHVYTQPQASPLIRQPEADTAGSPSPPVGIVDVNPPLPVPPEAVTKGKRIILRRVEEANRG